MQNRTVIVNKWERTKENKRKGEKEEDKWERRWKGKQKWRKKYSPDCEVKSNTGNAIIWFERICYNSHVGLKIGHSKYNTIAGVTIGCVSASDPIMRQCCGRRRRGGEEGPDPASVEVLPDKANIFPPTTLKYQVSTKHCQRHNGPRNWLRDLD